MRSVDASDFFFHAVSYKKNSCDSQNEFSVSDHDGVVHVRVCVCVL